MTLLEFLQRLLGNAPDSLQLREQFTENPHGTLTAFGLGHLSPEDVLDALVLVQDNDVVSFDRDHAVDVDRNPGGNPPGPASGPDMDPAEQIRQQLLDSQAADNAHEGNTITDQPVNQNIDSDGGDSRPEIGNHSVNATGDGAVAAGGDIEGSTITTRDDNLVGNGDHVVFGEGDATAFGSGNAVKDVSNDDGSAFSVDGNATDGSSTNNSHNHSWSEDSDRTSIDGSFNQETDNSDVSHVDDHSNTDVGSSHNDVDLHFS